MDNNNSKRILALLLSLVMMIGIFPVSAFASTPINHGTINIGNKGTPGPNWEDETSGNLTDGGDYWGLPQGVRVINLQNGADSLNAFGLTYRDRYKDDKGRDVLRFRVSQKQAVATSVWTNYILRLSPEVYQGVNWNDSFITTKMEEIGNVEVIKFVDSPIAKQQLYTKSFPYRDTGTTYRFYDINLVLNNGIWDANFKNKNQAIQLRLYDKSGSRIASTSSKFGARGIKYTTFNYNAYTKVATISSENPQPKDWIPAQARAWNNDIAHVFWSADSGLQLDRAKGKVRIVYSNTNGGYSETWNKQEGFAIRQSFDKKFIKILDLSDKDKEIGTISTFDYDEKPYGDIVPIKVYNLKGVKKDPQGNVILDSEGNPIYTREDKAVFIEVASENYVDKTDQSPEEKAATIKTKGKNFANNYLSLEANLVVFEYNINPQVIEKELKDQDSYVKNFFFDTRYVTDSSMGYTKFTKKLDKDLIVPGGKTTWLSATFTPNLSLSTLVGQRDKDFVLQLGNSKEAFARSWKESGFYWSKGTAGYRYQFPLYGKGSIKLNDRTAPNVGFTIPAGEEISVYVPNDVVGRTDAVTFSVQQGPSESEAQDLKDTTLTLAKEDKPFYGPAYIENTVSTIGGTAMRIKDIPIVEEIFTDGEGSDKFVGYSHESQGRVISNFNNKNNEHIGYYVISSEAAKNGDVTFYVGDGNEELRKIDEKDIEKQVTIHGKEYTGYKFEIKKQAPKPLDQAANPNFDKSVKDLKLAKDMPVVFKVTNDTSLASNPVVEQVQARVKFHLDKDKNKTIEKIAPLNKEYRFDPETGEVNAKYTPSGFSGKNLSVDAKTPTVEVDRTPFDGSTDNKVNYPNFLDHNGVAYDVSKEEEKADFLKRIFPDAKYDKDLRDTDSLTVKGWTTKPLEDIPGGKTAIQQYNELVQKGNVIKTVDDWKKAEVPNAENYVFTKDSPLDETLKAKEVYAVWGTPSLVLHANNTEDPAKETVIYLPYGENDVKTTNEIIDAMTSPTKENLRKNNVIKKLPLVPYKYDTPQKNTDGNDNFDKRFESFIKTNSTFIGWTLKRYSGESQDGFVAGNNNERLAELEKGQTINGKSLPKNTESREKLEQQEKIAYVPNGWNYAEPKSLKELFNAGEDIHLYANYKEYFTITVKPDFKNIEGKDFADVNKDGDYGKYVDTVEPSKKKPINVALLYRTAVTDYTTPTVIQSATYSPVTKEDLVNKNEDIIKRYGPNSSGDLIWKLPGFDAQGKRRSYVSVIVPDGKENVYESFNETKWQDLGISVYVKRNGATGEAEWAKNAPKEIHEESKTSAVYGTQLAKRQAYNSGVDAYTSATYRHSVTEKKGGYNEVSGYTIYNTSTPLSIPQPQFNKVMDTDKEFSLVWGEAENNAEINKINLEIPTGKGTKQSVILEKQSDGTFSGLMDGKNVNATVDNETGKITVNKDDNFNFGGLDSESIIATYETADGTKGESGKIDISIKQTSNKVKAVNQVAKKNSTDNARIKMQIPGGVSQPNPGTEYIAEKYDETTKMWVEVGKTTMKQTDNVGGYIEIGLDNQVKDGDLIRITAKEPDKYPISSVTDDDMKNNIAKDGKLDPTKVEGYVYLDLIGPASTATAQDEAFRRWIDIKGQFDEVPEGRVTISYKRDDQIETKEFETKDKAFKVLREIVALGNISDIKIIAKDDLGNEKSTKVDYEKTYVTSVILYSPQSMTSKLLMTAEENDTQVNLTIIKAKGGQFTVTPKVGKILTVINLTENGNPYMLQVGDIIKVEGTLNKEGKVYTTNPYQEIVRK